MPLIRSDSPTTKAYNAHVLTTTLHNARLTVIMNITHMYMCLICSYYVHAVNLRREITVLWILCMYAEDFSSLQRSSRLDLLASTDHYLYMPISSPPRDGGGGGGKNQGPPSPYCFIMKVHIHEWTHTHAHTHTPHTCCTCNNDHHWCYHSHLTHGSRRTWRYSVPQMSPHWTCGSLVLD